MEPAYTFAKTEPGGGKERSARPTRRWWPAHGVGAAGDCQTAKEHHVNYLFEASVRRRNSDYPSFSLLTYGG